MIIDGIYLSTVKRNEHTGFTIFKFKYYGPAHDRFIIYVQACIPIYVREMPLRIEGEFVPNKKNYFKATSVKEKISDNEISIAYLSNKNFGGIGPKRAKLIVDAVGPDIFSIIDSTDGIQKLKKIKGIPTNTIDELIVRVRNTIAQREIFEFLLKYYGTVIPAIKIAEKYKHRTMDVINDNPYICCTEFDIPFYTADAIAFDLGFDYLDKKRIEAIIFEAMKMSTSQGNVFLYQTELNNNIKFVIKNSAFRNDIPLTYIASIMVKCRWLKIEKEGNSKTKIFFKSLWLCESETARHINRLRSEKLCLPYKENIADIIEKKSNIKFHKAQKQAFNLLRTSGIKILTGGPGTGKTTILNGIIQAFYELNPYSKVVLCSPTGRASQRMAEQTGKESSTIHKLLEIKPYEDIYTTRDNIENIDADFIIVDEFSMIDIEIMSIFLNAIKNKTLVLFVGDVDQLPSVGPGNVMRDLIKSNVIELYKLTNVYRQTSGSVIVDNANMIIKGNNTLKFNDSFKMYELQQEESFNDFVVKLFDGNKTLNMNNTQILTTVRKGDGGANKLNKLIQKQLFDERDAYFSTFTIGDKVIINENNYTLGVFNGDLGIVKHILEDGIEIDIGGELVMIPNLYLDIVSLAYAITVHKSQGSEFENVVIVLPDDSPSMLQRNLLYTAITRAKSSVIILSKNGSFNTAIAKNYIIKRNTTLAEKII